MGRQQQQEMPGPTPSSEGQAATPGGVAGSWSITIGRPRREVYAFWRNFTNLAQFMDDIERIDVIDEQRSHWVVKAPAGLSVEWDSVITEDQPDRRIAWQSTDGLDIDEIENSGWVEFSDAPGGQGTEVCVFIRYEPPAGRIGQAIAKAFGREPSVEVPRDLQRLKQLMETGEAGS